MTDTLFFYPIKMALPFYLPYYIKRHMQAKEAFIANPCRIYKDSLFYSSSYDYKNRSTEKADRF